MAQGGKGGEVFECGHRGGSRGIHAPARADPSSKTKTAKRELMAGGERRLEGDWGLEVEGTVEADWVIEGFDVTEDHGMGRGAGGGMKEPKHSALRVAQKDSMEALS